MWPLIINVFGICYLLNVCVLSRYLSSTDLDYPLEYLSEEIKTLSSK